MKILIATTVFAPKIGGVEMVAALLARGLQEIGHGVTVLTNTPAVTSDTGPVAVVRQPSPIKTVRHYLANEAVVLIGLTLRLGWPLLLLRRSSVISHHGYTPLAGRAGRMRLARKALIRRTRHIACSAAVAASLGYRCQAVGNPYDDRTFKTDPTLPRDRELVFVGRLVPEKGPDVLLQALGILAKGGLKPCLTIVGDGPMRARLIASSQDLGLARQVEFVGPVVGRSLASQLNRHQVLVVPSRWNEPFGIVALEGIACGCVVVGSSGGGLPEAIGPCGVVFPNGDTAALASALQSLLPDSGKRRRLRDGAEAHLRPHQADTVARRYLEIISGSNHTTGNRRSQQ